MTKEEILKQIEELRKQVEKLPEDEKKIRTIPADEDKFIFLSTEIWKLNYDFRRESFDLVDGIFQPNASIGNYFKSEEDARMVIKAMQIEQAIRLRRIELNDGWEPDWDDVADDKYFIYTKYGCLYADFAIALNYCLIFGYYKSIEIAQQVIDEFKDDLEWYFNEYYPNKDKMYVWE